MNLEEAGGVLLREGWLAAQPPPFQRELLAGSSLRDYRAGDVLYRIGDPVGGIFGLVSGVMTVVIGPPHYPPRMLHVGVPGSWIGEGCFLSRQPRRVGVQLPVATRMLHVPLSHLDRMSAADPEVFRRITWILMGNLDTLVRAFCSQQDLDERRRVAATLLRLPLKQGVAVPLSQADLGAMSNVSRKMVNFALKEFTASGWIVKGYRSITLLDRAGLEAFVEERFRARGQE